MTDTRTGPLVGKLVTAVQEDLAEIVGYLGEAREIIGQLEGQTKGVNGPAAFLKGQGLALDKMMSDLTDEAEEVAKKLLGGARVEITHRVNDDHAAAVRAAKEAA